jgi:hypothetical protein
MVSLWVYVIVYCFKQYAIFSYLREVNQQKKNAFSSYTLFDAAVGDADTEAKRMLLMSLAKTIHEAVKPDSWVQKLPIIHLCKVSILENGLLLHRNNCGYYCPAKVAQ